MPNDMYVRASGSISVIGSRLGTISSTLNRERERAAPVAGSVFARLGQLVLLLVIARLVDGTERTALLSVVGLSASLAILTESGFSQYLLAECTRWPDAGTYRTGLFYHFALSVLGASAALVAASAALFAHPDGSTVLIAISLIASQAFESTMRTARTPWLVGGKFVHYSLPEISTTLAKLPFLGLAILSRDSLWLAAIGPVCMVSAAATAWGCLRRCEPPGSRRLSLISQIVPYGLGGNLSALYSQAPLVIAGFLLSPSDVAQLSVVYRVTQPVELLPATASQQAVRSLRDARRVTVLRHWASYLAVGCIVAIVLALTSSLISDLFRMPTSFRLLLILGLASIPLKFGNYLLVAGVLARRAVAARLRAALVCALLTVACVAVAAIMSGVQAVLLVSLATEALLAAMLFRAATGAR
jgi:hypothetical protein